MTWKPGEFRWVELATTDLGGARKFYGELFGWKMVENDMPDGEKYVTPQIGGEDVGGMCTLMEEQTRMGVPPHWGVYVGVEDADAAASKAEGLGGRIIKPPFDVMDVGRMAVLQDPTGAVFSVWQVTGDDHGGMGRHENVPGTLAWVELEARNEDVSGKFFMDLFGWTADVSEVPGGEGSYTTFMLGETRVGGMMKMSGDMPDMPPHFLAHFQADDVDATSKRVAELGGKVMVPPMDVPGVCRFSVVCDPQGAAFTLLEWKM